MACNFQYITPLTKLHVSGIYKITNTSNGKSYIGSSTDVYVRVARHKSDLLKDRHSNLHLQQSVNKHSLSKFSIELLIICEPDMLAELELFYMRYYNVEYNMCEVTSLRKNKFSLETRNKMSTTRLEKNGVASIEMLDNSTEEVIQAFSTLVSAAEFVLNSGLSNAKAYDVRGKISNAARNKYNRKPGRGVYGHRWRYVYAM